MSFQQGLSGLNSASKSLDVISNNVANASTVGFKQSQAQFADVFANTLSGSGGTQIGIGSKLASVSQLFSQGNVSVTNNPLDLAVNGRGFFRMSDSGAISYSRNGQFQIDKSGHIVNGNGLRLTGYLANAAGVLDTAAPTDLLIPSNDLTPNATSEVNAVLNVDSRAGALSAAAFDLNDPTTYNNSTSVAVFDSLGNAHTLSTYFLKTAANTWQVFAANDGVPVGPPVATPLGAFTTTAGGNYTLTVGGVSILTAAAPGVTAANVDTAVTASAAALTAAGITSSGTATAGTLSFTKTNGTPLNVAETLGAGGTAGGFFGLVAPGTTTNTYASIGPVGTLNFSNSGAINTATTTLPFVLSTAVTTGAVTPLAVDLDFTGTTQFGSDFGVNSLAQDGFTSGRLSGFAIGGDGVILGRYTNGQSATLGQVILANFNNPQGLQPLGDNGWAETSTSGAPLVGSPSSGSLGALQSAAVEESNVDLTAELVNMITAQRIYQANAQSIKTQDAVLQTLVNLR